MAQATVKQMMPGALLPLLQSALSRRSALFDASHQGAIRLFNGFSEGQPSLVIDIYATTLLIHNYASEPTEAQQIVDEARQFLQNELTWLRAGIVKVRNAKSQEAKRGQLLFGEQPDTKIKEHNVWYSIDLMLNRDASFYIDTRNLRKWLVENMHGRTVLNTFAYTGSLGVAATAGGAVRVVQHDLNRQFLNVAKTSYVLNGFPIHKQDFIAADFFPLVSRLKRTNELFDCVIVDPPFFSTTSRGKIDQVRESARLINKVRPLVRDGGSLIAINNALFVSGSEYLRTLEELSKDGYLKVKELIPVPEDCTGYDKISPPVTDPAPFNHATKIAILEVRRKPSTR
jgi:23S rRNA (cytosine1962-C5)-methyltransferase